MTPPKVCERVNILGVGLSVINRPSALRLFIDAVKQQRRGYITVTGVHGVMECQQDEELRAIHNEAFLCTPDGMPMVWLGRNRQFLEMARVIARFACWTYVRRPNRSAIFYGGAKGVAATPTEVAARFHVGTYEPPFVL